MEQPIKPSNSSRKRLWSIVTVVVVVVVVVGIAAGIVVTRPTTVAPSSNVTFYTWWATEGKIALNHIIPSIKNATGLTLVPTISPGAGGTNAKYAILALIKAGSPPASFQTHFGPEMLSYVELAPNGVNSFMNITSLTPTSNVVGQVFLAGTFAGTELSAPTQVHRSSLLWVNWKVLESYGLPFPYNLTTLQSDTQALAAKGFTMPWMIPGADSGWDQLNLWEDLFLAYAGPIYYQEIVYGTLNVNSPVVAHYVDQTNSMFLNLTTYDYTGWQTLSWTQGLTDLIQGKTAFQANGNWLTNFAYDYDNVSAVPPTPAYLSNSSTTLVETPFPGTQNYYAVVIDSLAIPKGTEQNNAVKIAQYWMSWQGQHVWSKWKGVSYFSNITSNFYNTPAQWADYQNLIDMTNNSNFVYALSDGGVFDDVSASLDGGMLALQTSGSGGLSIWNSILAGSLSEQQNEWKAANSIGLGYLGSPGHPFGGYIPPWASSAGAPSTVHTTSQSVHSNSSPNVKDNSKTTGVFTNPYAKILTILRDFPTG